MSFAPLRGIRVVDFCSNIAGPFASMILAQLGADVVKVEPPGGDDARHFASRVDGLDTCTYGCRHGETRTAPRCGTCS